MRISPLLPVLVMALLMTSAGSAHAANTESLSTSVRLIRQPAGQAWWISLTLGARIGTTDGAKPSPLRKLVFLFHHATINAGAFPTCTIAKLETPGARACARRSRLGSGTSLIDASPLLNPVHATVTMFNGARRHGNPTFLFMAQAQEVPVTLYLKGTHPPARAVWLPTRHELSAHPYGQRVSRRVGE